MRDDNNRKRSAEPSESDSLENTRRGFLGATAGAGIAGKLFGLAEDDSLMPENMGNDAENSVAVQEELADQAGVFDIRDYGAVGDGETDNTEAIYEAIEAAAEVQGTVLIPNGEFVTDWIILRHEHNGITITGLGYGSVISPLQAVDPEACWTWGVYNDETGAIPIDRTNFTHGIQLNDSFSPPEPFPGSLGNEEISFSYREDSPIQNITIKNLRLDGKREQIPIDNTDETWETPRYDNGSPETPLGAPTGRGINFAEGSGDSNNRVYNVWSHSWMFEGFDLKQGGTNAHNLIAWDNGFHGLGLAGPETAPQAAKNISNVVAYWNGQYGIDHSGGVSNISNFSLFNNGWGMKLAGPDRLSAVNGRLVNNVHQGLQMTDPTDQALLDNITSRDNGGGGFHCWQAGEIHIGRLSVYNNNQRTEPTQFADDGPQQGEEMLVTDDMEVVADQINIKDGPNAGLTLASDGGTPPVLRVGDLSVTGCGAEAVNQQHGELVVGSGHFSNNGSSTVVVGDDAVTTTIDDVSGFPTAATGTASFAGGGGQKTFTIDHGLAVAPHYANAVADASSDAPTVAGVKNVTDTSFDVEFGQAAPSGSRDEENVTVHWEASAY